MPAAKSETGFDPNRSRVSDEKMQHWHSADISDGDLKHVPGIGPAAVEKLADYSAEPITNIHQLIGKYLMLKGPNQFDENGNVIPVSCMEHNDKFWHFLAVVGISSHRSAIVKAIAERADLAFPGLYDSSIYDGEESY